MAVARVFEGKGWTAQQYDELIAKLVGELGLAPGKSAPGVLFHWSATTDDGMRAVTVAEGLRLMPPEPLDRIFPGSWINANFDVWIGPEEDNKAWAQLLRARDTFEAATTVAEQQRRLAYEELLIAEGSDWCWWYGDDHSSENDREFDELFRKHLINIYTSIDREPPDHLFIPITREDRRSRPTVELTAFISPVLDGEVTSYFEWLAAGYYDVSQMGGTMHRAESVVSHIYYGFDLGNLFIRLDSNRDMQDPRIRELMFCIHILKPVPCRIEVRLDPEAGKVDARVVRPEETASGGKGRPLSSIAARDIIEMAVPFEMIDARPKDEVIFFTTVRRDDIELEKWPYRGYISFNVPTEDFEAIMWHV